MIIQHEGLWGYNRYGDRRKLDKMWKFETFLAIAEGDILPKRNYFESN